MPIYLCELISFRRNLGANCTHPVTNSSVNFVISIVPSGFLSKKAVKFFVMAIMQQKTKAIMDPVMPCGATYAIDDGEIPCIRLARTKKTCEIRIDIHESRPKMETMLTKYVNTITSLEFGSRLPFARYL